MPLPIVYNNKASELVNYSWEDFADGTGRIIFNGFTTKDLAGTQYKLSTATPYSADIILTSAAGTTDWDFDLTQFNSPRTIQGTALIQGRVGLTTSANANVSVAFRLRKWDGTTETEIAVASGASIMTYIIGGGSSDVLFNIPMIIPQTHFKVGDVLRYNVNLVGGDANGTVRIGVDPKNRAPPTDMTSQLIFNVPFRIDTS